jgi:hypothetical protein
MGRNPAMVKRVIIVPDWVFRVICHIIAYCTTIEPNNDNVWPIKNSAVFLFQLISIPVPFLLSVFSDNTIHKKRHFAKPLFGVKKHRQPPETLCNN